MRRKGKVIHTLENYQKKCPKNIFSPYRKGHRISHTYGNIRMCNTHVYCVVTDMVFFHSGNYDFPEMGKIPVEMRRGKKDQGLHNREETVFILYSFSKEVLSAV